MEGNNGRDCTSCVNTEKNILIHQTNPTQQNNTVRMPSYWVNVFFSVNDALLSDADLIEKIHSYILNREASITTEPEDEIVGHCLSIKVKPARYMSKLTSGTADGLYHMADDRIHQWIVDFPQDGLPFSRSHAFR
ncbi:hypothetical protein N7510_001297 [Penicillium lagena]|uniref:uncharacterized protein n=1 Tax=Penicillium lagena TaxID=94218 RepID=UPI0025416603|nr:uncharacterized protein N7510_001297 [Penicillium lagena]KAJ5624988.1 hypothetical protein N7510_001297 [Penicillium lagena]